MSENFARILIVDDDLSRQQHSAAALRTQGLSVDLRTPDRVEDADLLKADVIAVDHYYDWENLPHPKEPAYWPQDGLAISAVLAGQMRLLETHAAIVLRTGELPRLASGLPLGMREPLLAAQNSLEWILVKGDELEGVKLGEIASSFHNLSTLIGDKASWNDGSEWFALPSENWTEAALADVQVCRPPEHAVAAYTSGSAWFRWFAQRILPFPTFLLSDRRAATLLRLPLADFQTVVSEDSALSARLLACEYRGSLATLVDRRWWRAGLDALIDEILALADPGQSEAEAIASGFSSWSGRNVVSLSHRRPVTTIDFDYFDDGSADASECVRLAPDSWPVYADEPWARLEDVNSDPELALLVSRGDRNRLSATGAGR